MPGQINWVELPAAETAKARAFYGGLFGWGTSEFGGDYHVIGNGPARSRLARMVSPIRGSTSPRRTSTPRPSVSTSSAEPVRRSTPFPELAGSRTATTIRAPRSASSNPLRRADENRCGRTGQVLPHAALTPGPGHLRGAQQPGHTMTADEMADVAMSGPRPAPSR
jgi:hypothetical protein